MKKKHILDLMSGGHRVIANNNEINANSRAEALERLLELASLASSGQLDISATHHEDAAAENAKQMAEFAAAYNDKTTSAWAEVGNSLSTEIYQRSSRQGFMRKFLLRGEVAQGAYPRIAVKTPQAYAVMCTGPTRVKTQFVRDRYVIPDEFNIAGDVRVDAVSMGQGTSDIIDRLFFDGQEAIMVKEDVALKAALDIAAGIANDTVVFSGSIGHATISTLQYNVNRWGVGARYLLLSMSFIKDLQSSMMLNDSFDPATKLEIFSTGTVGSWFGMDLTTDGLREASLQVLKDNELYVLGSPDQLGGYTERGPVRSEPRDNVDNIPSRGFFMWETVSLGVGNAKAVAKALRS